MLLPLLFSMVLVAQAYYTPPNSDPNSTTTTPGNNNLTQEMAKKTAEALKTFNNVNYKHMSDNKESFFDSNDNPYTDEGSKQKTFKIKGGDNDTFGSGSP